MRLKSIFKFISFAYLAIKGVESGLVCKPSEREGVDFICGNIPEPFQPCKDFDVVAGKADRSTTLWVLGVIHMEGVKISECVEEISKLSGSDIHKIYPEGYDGDMKCSSLGLTDKPNRKCEGMDDMQAKNEILSIMPDVSELAVSEAISKIEQAYLTTPLQNRDPNFVLHLQANKASHQQLKTSDEKKYKAQHGDVMVAAINQLLKEYNNKRRSFADIFKELKKSAFKPSYVSPEAHVKFKQAQTRRDKSFGKKFSEHPSGTLGIGIVGRDHVLSQTAHHSAASPFLREELEKLAANNPYAVLAMRNP